MNVLLVDNTRDRDSWGAGELVRALHRAGPCTIWVRRAPHEDLPAPSSLRRFDRIVLSGSRTAVTESAPWIARLDELIRRSLDDSIPLLGICYGHQALARVLGSSSGEPLVRRSGTPEIGWTEILRTSAHAGRDLLEGLPQSFHSFSVHYDEVSALPLATRLLASSHRCAIQAFAHERKPAFGVQFHPEREIEEGERTLRSSAAKKPAFPLLNPGAGPRLYSPDVARIIFGNFLKGSW